MHTEVPTADSRPSAVFLTPDMNITMHDPRRIVLLGKTGSGKSSLANTIFGEKDMFNVNHKSVSGSKTCGSKTKTIGSRSVQLIDTPGFLDTDPTSTEQSPEILRCITACAPGPHAFLVVMKVERYTKQEQAVVDLILKYFSQEALSYTTVVFTHGDQLPEGVKIEEWISDNEALRNLVQKCGGRCHVFDNRYWNNSQDQYRNNQVQVEKLLETIDTTVRENGETHYSNNVLQKIGDNTQLEVENIRTSSPVNITLKDIQEEAKQVVYRKLMKNMGGALTGVLVGALLGAGAMVVIASKFSSDVLQRVAAAVAGAVVGAPAGAVAGAWASEKWSCPTEAVQDAATFLRELGPLFLLVNQTYSLSTASS